MNILERLKEPSSWAGIAALLGTMGVNIPGPLIQSLMLVAAGAAGVLAFFLKEKGGAPPLRTTVLALAAATMLGVTACAPSPPTTAELAYQDSQALRGTMLQAVAYVARPTCAPEVTVPCATPEIRTALRKASEAAMEANSKAQALGRAVPSDLAAYTAARKIAAARRADMNMVLARVPKI